MTTGAGRSSAGVSPYGIGTPAVSDTNGGVPTPNTFAESQGSRYIDSKTRQYVYNSDGRAKGQANIPHLVQMAFLTVAGSSAMPRLGVLQAGGVIGNNFVSQRTQAIQAALKYLVDSSLIEIVEITVDAKIRPVFTRVRWRDLTTLVEQTDLV